MGKNILIMKKLLLLLSLFLILVSCNSEKNQNQINGTINGKFIPDTTDMTNNFYDNTETFALPVNEILVEGEIANPGKVDFSDLPIHSVIVKETLLSDDGTDSFVGAYRYDGYSLFDILNNRILKKANSEEFNPIIDLYVEVENEKGDKVVFSWGEIFYPNNLHRIIIATGVSRIVPSKTNDLWPLPSESKIVAGSDLVTERNISVPVKITVRSIRRSFIVNRNMAPLYSSKIGVFASSRKLATIKNVSDNLNSNTFNTIFYGRGRGIHSTTPFTGVLLRNVLSEYYPLTEENIKTGILCISGADGYRSAVSYSELFNRNDQQEFLLIRTDMNEEAGLFRIFASADFFSDRAIKAVSEIHLDK